MENSAVEIFDPFETGPLVTGGSAAVEVFDPYQDVPEQGSRTLDARTAAKPTTTEQDGWGEVAGAVVENVPKAFERQVGGAMQAMGNANPIASSTAGMFFTPENDPGVADIVSTQRERANAPGGISDVGRHMFEEATAEIQTNHPNIDPESLKGYSYDIAMGIANMVPMLATSVATRSPGAGMALMGGQVYGDRYGESIAADRTPEEAHSDAVFYAAAEAIPERLPLGIIMKQGGKFLPRVLKSAGAEGIQEVFTEALQAAYDSGVLNENMTWGEALTRMKRAGIVGAGMGGGMATVSHPFTNAQPTENQEKAEGFSEMNAPAREEQNQIEPVGEGEIQAPQNPDDKTVILERSKIMAEGEAVLRGEEVHPAPDVSPPLSDAQPLEAGQPVTEPSGAPMPEGTGERHAPVKAEVPVDVDLAAEQADTAPTDAQKEAGNYKKGHVKVQGLDIAIENPKGSVRSGTDEDGKAWETVMRSHYGYIKTAEGADGDKVDVFINTDTSNIGDTAFVIDQVVGGKFDEHKVILGADSSADAMALYNANYAPDWDGIGAITPMTMDEFKSWLKEGNTKKPFAWKAPVQVAPTGTNTEAPAYPDLNDPLPADMQPVTPQHADVPAVPKPVAWGGFNSKEEFDADQLRIAKGYVGRPDQGAPTDAQIDDMRAAKEARIQAIKQVREQIPHPPADNYARRKDGSAFLTERSALMAARNRVDLKSKGYRPVQVDGGWALVAGAVEEAPTQVTPMRPPSKRSQMDMLGGEEVRDSDMVNANRAQDVIDEVLKDHDLKDLTEVLSETEKKDPDVEAWQTQLLHRLLDEKKTTRAQIRNLLKEPIHPPMKEEKATEPVSVEEDASNQVAKINTPETEAKQPEATKSEKSADLSTKAPDKAEMSSDAKRTPDAVLTDYLKALAEIDSMSGKGMAPTNAWRAKRDGIADRLRALTAEYRDAFPGDRVDADLALSTAAAKQRGHPVEDSVEAQSPKTKPVDAQKQPDVTDKPQDKIEDFGEKIHGARKDTFTGFKEALSDEGIDVNTAPLSKSFPQPNYVKLAEEGVSGEVMAYIAVIRNTIPSKPRSKWKVARWAKQVDLLRGFANDILSGNVDTKTLDHMMKVANATTLGDIPTTVKAIKDIAPADMEKAAQYSVRSASYSMFKGERYNPSKSFWFLTDSKNRTVRNPMGNDPAMQDTHRESEEEAISLAKKLIPYLIAGTEETGTKTRSKYTAVNVYRDHKTSDIFLGFKVRSTVLRLKAGFETPTAAREYLDENRDDVQAKIDDMRKGPNMRGTENRARSGQDLRDGDVSPETFSEAFGFRGVQFGNYVEGPRRQSDLNRAYDALMDLADTIGVPPKAISLNGELGLAFGARGTGGNNAAAAHYEPGQVVINLTKGSGPGSLAHEWLHGLDNYFARQDDHGKSKATGQDHDYMSSRRRTEGTARDEVYQAWKGVQTVLAKGGFAERSVELDKAKSKPYWNKTIEKAARAFEKYMVDRLSEKGAINDYLANIDQTSGAYPTNDEMKQDGIREAFDNLFDTIEHRETDKGVEMFSVFNDPDWMGVAPGLDWKGQAKIVEVKKQYEEIEDASDVRRLANQEISAPDGILGEYQNLDTGWDIHLYAKGIRKTLSGEGSKIRAALAWKLPDLLKNAILVETVSDKKTRADINRIHRFYAAAQMDGDVRRIKITVREHNDGVRRQYDIDHLDIEKPGTGLSPSNDRTTSGVGSIPLPGSAISIRQLLDNVNSEVDGKPVMGRGESHAIIAEYDWKTSVDRQKLGERVIAIAMQINPKTKVEVKDDAIFRDVPGHGRIEVSGVYSPLKNLIEVAIDRNPEKAVRHEEIHALKHIGIFTQTEISIMSGKAKREWMKRYDIKNRYPELSQEKQYEEATAQAFAEYAYAKDHTQGRFAPGIRRIFDKIKQFFERLSNALKKMGYQTVEDIFDRVESGEVGARNTDDLSRASATGEMYSLIDDEQKTTQAADRTAAEPAMTRQEAILAKRKGFKFSNAETEKRWQDARAGREDPQAMVHRVQDWLSHVIHGFTRHHINLPNEPEFAKAHETLRKVEAAPQAAKEESTRILRDITDGMTARDLDLFTRKVVLDDLVHEADQEHDLPFGLTAETLPIEKAKVDANVMARPELREALKKRNRFVSKISRQLVEAGILKKEQLQNPAYFHHQVLDYARAQQVHLGAKKSLRTPRPGYARGRKGSTLDISAHYLEAEFEWLHKAQVDISTAKAIETLKEDYDKHETVKTATEEANKLAVAKLIKSGKAKDDNGARTILRNRKQWAELEAFIPEGHVLWQPDKGNLFFVSKTLPERAVDHLMDALAHESVPGVTKSELEKAVDQMRTALVIGGPKYRMVIPEALAKTLDGLRNDVAPGLFDHLLATPLAMWKRWVLINPRRVLKYNINNMSGDLDAVIAGNPRAIKKMPVAIKELWHVMHGAEPSARYREAVERGVFDSGLSAQEIPDIKVMSEFEDVIRRPTLKAPHRLALAGMMKVWRTLQRYTGFRENWLRYAAYLDYVERLEAGEAMDKIGYGAAVPKMVDAITDPKDRAAMLARELVGDYGNVSAFGQSIRNRVIPFYSWMEINTKRYARLFGNAYGQGLGNAAQVGVITGAGISARLALRMVVMYGLVHLYNNLFFGDEEDELSDEERVRLHLNLGKDEDGKVRTLRFQGALSDFLGWFGFEDAVAAIGEVQKGRASAEDVLTAVAKAPINKVASGITPVIKTPVELLAGQSFWPDVFNPRSIKDGKRHVARLFSADHEYDWLADRPTRGYFSSLEQAVITKRDPDENAYNRTRSLAYEWLRREKGTEGGSNIQTPRSKALYDFRLAKKFGDRKAQRNARRQMLKLGMTNKDLQRSITRAHPLGMVAIKDRVKFVGSLTSQERHQLKTAIRWYEQTYKDEGPKK